MINPISPHLKRRDRNTKWRGLKRKDGPFKLDPPTEELSIEEQLELIDVELEAANSAASRHASIIAVPPAVSDAEWYEFQRAREDTGLELDPEWDHIPVRNLGRTEPLGIAA